MAGINNVALLAGGGEMGAQIRATDWSRTPLGALDSWSPELCILVRTLLNSRFPMLLLWGKELNHLYNDAFIEVLADKHPNALGAPAREVWAEIWDIINPLFEHVLNGGDAVWNEDLPLQLYRRGALSEATFTFSYSAVPDAQGNIGGILVTCQETTHQVQEARLLRTLREMSALKARTETVASAATHLMAALEENNRDFPFALLYLMDEGRTALHLAASAGLAEYRGTAVRQVVPLDSDSQDDPWRLTEVARARYPVHLRDLEARVGAMPEGFWNTPPQYALCLPLNRQANAALEGVLILGLSPRRALDEQYRGFITFVSDHVLNAIENVRAYEEARKRAEILASNSGQRTSRGNDGSRLLSPAESRYRALFDSIEDGFCIIEVYFDAQERPVDYRFLEYNPAFPRHTGLQNVLGKSVREMGLPLESHWFELYGSVARTGESIRFENYADSMNRWFDVYAFRIDDPQECHVALLFRDITARKRMEERLQEEKVRLQRVIDIETIGVMFIKPDGTVTGSNNAFLRASGYTREEIESGLVHLDAMTPPEWREQSQRALKQMRETGHTTPYEKEYIRKDGSRWWGLFASSRLNEEEGVKFILDITESKATQAALEASERRQAYLVKLSDVLRPLADPGMVKAVATRVLGEQLGANRVTYAEIAPDGSMRVDTGYSNGVAPMPVHLHPDQYDPALLERLRTERLVVVPDILAAPSIGPEERARMEAIEVSSYAAVPLIKEGFPVAILALHQAEPREWSAEEIELAEETAERTWAALERARAERELSELNATLEKRVRERTAQVEQLTGALTLAEQEERQRVSQILHDDLQQQLYSVLVRLQLMAAEVGTEKSASALQELTTQVTRAVKVTRNLVTELNPPILESEGLAAALRWLAAHISELYGLRVHLLVKDECEPRSKAMRSLLVQITRELLFNVVKHSKTEEAWLIVEEQDGALKLHVEDRGVGFEVTQTARVPHRSGYGLHSIAGRLSLVEGNLTIWSQPGVGSRITLTVPCIESEPLRQAN